MRWRRQRERFPVLEALPIETPKPEFELITVRRGEEVAQARAEARAEFERILPATKMVPPTVDEMARWWGG